MLRRYKVRRPDDLLKTVLSELKVPLRGVLGDKERNKLAWLYDRIARRLGVPPASSYSTNEFAYRTLTPA
jgi:hypothetical protein